MRKKIRHAFTLIELLVVITLVAMVATASSIGIYKSVEHYRFQTSCNLLENKIRFAHLLSKLMQSGVSLSFKHDEKGVCVFLDCEVVPTDGIQRLLRQKMYLSGFDKISCNDSFQTQEMPFTISIYPENRTFQSTTKLEIPSPRNNDPHTISIYSALTTEQLSEQSNALYPHELAELYKNPSS